MPKRLEHVADVRPGEVGELAFTCSAGVITSATGPSSRTGSGA